MTCQVTYDLLRNNSLCDGSLIFDGSSVKVIQDGNELLTVPIGDISELIQRTYMGCGTLEAVPRTHAGDMSDSVLLCRFTMAKTDEIAEFTKVVNHYIRTGEFTEISDGAYKVCPKCGRHYARGMNVCLFCVEKNYLPKKLWGIAKPYVKKIAGAAALVTLASASSAFVPVLNARLVDGYFYSKLDTGANIKGILFTVAMICLLQIASQILRIFSQRKANRISCRISADLRLTVYDKIQRLSVSSMSGKTAGDLMKRVTRDTETVKRFITEQGLYAAEKIIMFIVVFILLANISPLLTFLVIIPVPVVAFLISRFWKFIHVRFEKQWRTDSKSNSILHDIVKGIRVVKTFGSEEREIKKFDKVCKDLADISMSNEHTWALIFPFLGFLMGIGEFFVLIFGGKMVIDGKMTIGGLLEFTLFLSYIYQPLRWLSNLPRRLAEVQTSLIKIFEILDEKEELNDQNKGSIFAGAGDIVFENVRFGYKAYEPVLKSIDLHVRRGEMIGLVGHSGAGKSTLINLIMRLYDPDEGRITVNGTDIRCMSQNAYREHISVVFQETFLFAGTIYDNIAYARPGATHAEIIAAAKAANAHEFIMKTPDGYNTIVGENGHNLSGGEVQRISIARAVLRNPDILILDEATSALDPETETAIQDALAKLVQGRTTFAIAHRLSTLKNADRLVVIEKGEIAETGTHRELMQLGGIYAGLVMAQRQTTKMPSSSS